MPLATRRDIGQFLIGSMPGTTIPVELRSLAKEFDLGGVILFGRNIETPEQVAELSAECEALGRAMPAWVSVDQEGGRVARLKEPFTKWPPMATLGRAGREAEALAQRFAKALAEELIAVGITLDYAPVLDIHTNPKNPVIGDRALAERAEDVARLGRVIIRGLQDAGLAACGKHFPGHGDTSTDSHLELPLVEHPPDRLRAIEFEPFRAAIAEEVAFIMTAHVLVPALDENKPATLSPHVVQKLLREELKFDGVILSDDLEMKAVSAHYDVPAAAVEAVAAGCDAVLVCQGNVDLQARTLEALVKAVESGVMPAKRHDAAAMRLKRAKQRFLTKERPGPSARMRALRGVLGREEHQLVAAEMAAYL
ncbi:MAG TPA: beta-N-acetylhexosaminidase [Vicinamibacterales bacterium]|nr:beta-N-acetylhexosaminidase [Vicinamibacterales bacterium]